MVVIIMKEGEFFSDNVRILCALLKKKKKRRRRKVMKEDTKVLTLIYLQNVA